jgi:IMP dehydrogenase
MKKVEDVMTADSVKSCTLETKLHEVAKTMKEANRGALPVVDKNNKVIGIVTDRDVCLSLATKKEKEISALTVKDAIQSLKVHTVKAEDNITKALEEMRINKIGRLPVTDKEGKLKGMISVNNLLSHTLAKKEELGQITSKEENLAKTIKTLFDRNNSKHPKSETETMESIAF